MIIVTDIEFVTRDKFCDQKVTCLTSFITSQLKTIIFSRVAACSSTACMTTHLSRVPGIPVFFCEASWAFFFFSHLFPVNVFVLRETGFILLGAQGLIVLGVGARV